MPRPVKCSSTYLLPNRILLHRGPNPEVHCMFQESHFEFTVVCLFCPFKLLCCCTHRALNNAHLPFSTYLPLTPCLLTTSIIGQVSSPILPSSFPPRHDYNLWFVFTTYLPFKMALRNRYMTTLKQCMAWLTRSNGHAVVSSTSDIHFPLAIWFSFHRNVLGWLNTNGSVSQDALIQVFTWTIWAEFCNIF